MSRYQKVTITLLAITAILSFAYILQALIRQQKPQLYNPDNYPYKFSVTEQSHYSRFVCDDINFNGNSELFFLLDKDFEEIGPSTSMFLYSYVSDRLQIKKEFYFGCDFYPSFFDFDEDGVKDILAFKRRNDSVFVEIRTLENDTIANFFAVTKDKYTLKADHLAWDSSIYFMDYVDLNSDGIKDLVCRILTNRRATPRGLYCFDYQNGQIIWEYPSGALIHAVDVFDVNKDGHNEYLLSTSCVRNLDSSVVINGTNDWHVYFIIVNILITK